MTVSANYHSLLYLKLRTLSDIEANSHTHKR